MKKTISLLFVLIILLLSLLSSVFAVSAEVGDSQYVLGPNAEYITHEGKKYYPLNDYKDTFEFNYDYVETDRPITSYYDSFVLYYADDEIRDIFGWRTSYVYVSTEVDCPCIEVELNTVHNSIIIPFVEESYLQEYIDFANGVSDSYYMLRENNYYFDKAYAIPVTADALHDWMSGEKIEVNTILLSRYAYNSLIAFDNSGIVNTHCGGIFIDTDTEEVYLYKPADGTELISTYAFDYSANTDVTVYRLEDDTLREEIITFYNTEPEEELEWLEPDEEGTPLRVIFGVLLFGVIPVALAVFSVVMLFVVKDKRYLRPYILMLIGAVLVVVAFIAVIVILI